MKCPYCHDSHVIERSVRNTRVRQCTNCGYEWTVAFVPTTPEVTS